MMKYQKELLDVPNEELLVTYENNVTTREVEFDKYGRVTKNTMTR